jgi:predicted RNase H-like HicB family nuclease
MRYWVIYERDEESEGWGAYAPDVPGCGVAGASSEDVRQLIREALAFHLDDLRAQGLAVPPSSPTPWAEVVDVDVPAAMT